MKQDSTDYVGCGGTMLFEAESGRLDADDHEISKIKLPHTSSRNGEKGSLYKGNAGRVGCGAGRYRWSSKATPAPSSYARARSMVHLVRRRQDQPNSFMLPLPRRIPAITSVPKVSKYTTRALVELYEDYTHPPL